MTDTYCGKSCDTCTQRAHLQCPGCQMGPGRAHSGECEIALCCHQKGHETCNTCVLRTNCSSFHRREYIPEYLQRAREYESEKKAKMAESIPFYAKWLWFLFLLVIPNIISNLMTSDTAQNLFPGLYRPGEILGILTILANALILLKLSTKNEAYRKPAYCNLALMALNFFIIAFRIHIIEASLTIVFAILPIGIALYSYYTEVHAHADVVAGFSKELFENWHNIWKWYLYSLGTSLASILIAVIIPFFGVLTALGASIALFIVNILKLVYLYRTAMLFREYPLEQLD